MHLTCYIIIISIANDIIQVVFGNSCTTLAKGCSGSDSISCITNITIILEEKMPYFTHRARLQPTALLHNIQSGCCDCDMK